MSSGSWGALAMEIMPSLGIFAFEKLATVGLSRIMYKW